MWIDKTLVALGRELDLKIADDTVFGVFNDQYLSVKRTQQGYIVTFLIKTEALDVIKGIFDKKKSIEISGSRFHNYIVANETLIILNVKPRLTSKKSVESILSTITLVSERLRTHQKFLNASTEKAVLIEEVPKPFSEEKLQEVRSKLEENANKRLDHERALIIGGPIAAMAGIILGYLSSLMALHLKSDLNPIAKGILSVTFSTVLYNKLAGGVNSASRYFILLISIIGFICWDLSRIFFQVLQQTGKEFELSKLVEAYEREIFSYSTLGKYALVGIGTIIVFSIFFLRRTDRREVDFQEGYLLRGEILEALDATRKGQVLIFIIFFLGVISILPLIPLTEATLKEYSYFTLLPFWGAGFLFLSVVMLIFYALSKKWRRLRFGLSSFNKGNVKKASIVGHLLLISIPPTLGFLLFLSYLNLAFDESPTKKTIAVLQEYFPSTKDLCKNVDLKIKNSQEKFSYRICKNDYSYIEQGTEVEFDQREGSLGIPYIFNLQIPTLQSLSSFLTSGKSARELRLLNIHSLLKYDNSKKFQSEIKNWEAACSRSPDYNCRLISYVYGSKNNHKKELSLLQKGCFEGQDPVACRGIVVNKESSELFVKQALSHLESKCEKGFDEHCMEWGWSVAHKSTAGYDQLKKIFEKPCKRGYKEACVTLNNLSKR